MAKIKIISNPYKKRIKYQRLVEKPVAQNDSGTQADNERTFEWQDVEINGPLTSKRLTTAFFPFVLNEILDEIIKAYKTEENTIEIIFEGAPDEFNDLKDLAETKKYADIITVSYGERKAGEKISNSIARKAALSPEELKAIEESRDKYLQGKPDPTDPAEVALTMRLMAANAIEIYNAYLPLISSIYYPVQPEAEFDGSKFDAAHNIRYFNITKWVIDKEEKNLEKLVNVYESLSNENCNIALVFHREIERTRVYLAVTNNQNADDNSEAQNYIERLKGAIRGNFPGSRTGDVKSGGLPCLGNNRNYSVASVTNIPTEKSEKFISQTIEKLLDGIVPEKVADEYVIILLATPIDNVEERKLRLGEIYSGLKPYECPMIALTLAGFSIWITQKMLLLIYLLILLHLIPL